MLDWDSVEAYIDEASGIAFDTCHKIYVIMDDKEVENMRGYGYGDEPDTDSLVTKSEKTASEMFEIVQQWYADSCGLRFVQAVASVPEGTDPNEGFTTLIGQGDSDEEECEDCLEMGCLGACYVERCDNCGWDEIYEDGMCRDCYDDSQEEDEDE